MVDVKETLRGHFRELQTWHNGLAPTLLSFSSITGHTPQTTQDKGPGDSNGLTNKATRKGLFQMLVLTRKRTEMIKIGEDIVITVVHTSRGSVKLGIQAPSNVRVLRAELDNRPMALPEAAEHADLDDDLLDGPVFSADQFLQTFDADYVADLEDQTLLCLAK